MIIGITSDHKGYEMKEQIKTFLKEENVEVKDFGTNTTESVDYPDYAHKLCESIIKKQVNFGIAICYTGIGMSIACNKVKGIRAAKVSNELETKLTREHNDANVLVLSSMLDIEEVKKIIKIFINTPFSNEERHIRRINKLEDLCI